MKLASYIIEGRRTFGAVTGDGLVDLGARLERQAPTLLDALSRVGVEALRELARGTTPDHALTEVQLTKPIAAPGKIFCVGVNYVDRNAEYRDDSDNPRYPSLFMRTPGSLVGPGESLVHPRESAAFDYEGEIAMVIGKAGRRIPPSVAWSHVAGLTLVNDGTARDWVRHGKFNVTQGKNFEASGAMGPYLVTLDECPAFDQLELRTWVNDELRQHERTDRLLFPFESLVAYISTFSRLEPGDIISTGTPTGAGARLSPPRYLQAGDRVKIEVEGVGCLENVVIEEGQGG